MGNVYFVPLLVETIELDKDMKVSVDGLSLQSARIAEEDELSTEVNRQGK